MILPFSQEINGKKTYFAEKIRAFLSTSCLFSISEWSEFYDNLDDFDFQWDFHLPKIHTIRKDEKNRWKAGNKIHAVYNNRQKSQFQFAPTFECKSVQLIQIEQVMCVFIITVDDKTLNHLEIEILARNDGFENSLDFFDFFDHDFYGKIIHFSDFRYGQS